MKVAIVGAGLVGTVTGEGLRKHGHKIVYIDSNPAVVAKLQGDGHRAFQPKDYPEITTDITMICVPTPIVGGEIDRKPLHQAVYEFAKRLKNHSNYHLLVIRSTVTPETTRKYVLPIVRRTSVKNVGKDFGLCVQPEFLRASTAADDFERPWQILIGEYDKKSGGMLEKLYSSFDAPIQRMTLEEAEFQKYIHNTFNALKISFFNEMRLIARHHDWDAEKIFYSVAESSEGIWNPLYGLKNHGAFAGQGLPKDIRALLAWGDQQGHDLSITRTLEQQNSRHAAALEAKSKVKQASK